MNYQIKLGGLETLARGQLAGKVFYSLIIFK